MPVERQNIVAFVCYTTAPLYEFILVLKIWFQSNL